MPISLRFYLLIDSRPNYTETRPLLVILHDPPEMLASPDPRTGKVEMHNTWIVRPTQTVTPTQKTY
jgi:histone deacetylase 6